MLQLVVLLAYGLFNLPIFLWKYADKKQTLYKELERAEAVRKEYREAVADFYMIVSQCRNMIANNRTGNNTAYMDILEKELPKKDLDGASINYSSNFVLDISPGHDVSADYIANVRYQFKVQYFLVKRKKSRWHTLYDKVNSLIETPVNFDKAYMNRDLEDPHELPKLDEMVLKPKPNDQKEIKTYRILSILSLIFCLFVIATEATVIYDPQFTLMYIVSGPLLLIRKDRGRPPHVEVPQLPLLSHLPLQHRLRVLLHHLQLQVLGFPAAGPEAH